jgi:hypothetical protein
VIEIDFWQLSDFDVDFDGYRPSLGSPYEHLAIYNYEIIESLRRTKMPCPKPNAYFRGGPVAVKIEELSKTDFDTDPTKSEVREQISSEAGDKKGVETDSQVFIQHN